jgi:hypothetical protein
MKRLIGPAVVIGIALGGCGGGADDAGGELTREHVLSALREAEPTCSAPRYLALASGDEADTFARGVGPTTYVSDRWVIQPIAVSDSDAFAEALRQRCACEVRRN